MGVIAGEDELKRLSFNDPIGISVMGLVVLWVIYFAAAVFFLHISRVKYVNIGFQGSKAKQIILANIPVSENGDEVRDFSKVKTDEVAV